MNKEGWENFNKENAKGYGYIRIIFIISKLLVISEAIRSILIFFSIYIGVNNFNSKFYIVPNFLTFFINFPCGIPTGNIKEGKIKVGFEVIDKDGINTKDKHINNITKDDKVLSLLNTINSSYFEWLAGIIDGDGHFYLSKNGTSRLIITMEKKDELVLEDIKSKFGGTVSINRKSNKLKYQLKNKKGLVKLLKSINGLIRNPYCMLQMKKLNENFGILFLPPKPLTFNNGWFSGIFDSDGSFYLNEKRKQIFISITQRNKYILESLVEIYGGKIIILNSKTHPGEFKYIVYKKKELLILLSEYFNKYPLRTHKSKKLYCIKQYYTDLFQFPRSLNPGNWNNNEEEYKWISFKYNWNSLSITLDQISRSLSPAGSQSEK